MPPLHQSIALNLSQSIQEIDHLNLKEGRKDEEEQSLAAHGKEEKWRRERVEKRVT